MAADVPDFDPSKAMARKLPIRIALVWVFIPLFFLVTGGSPIILALFLLPGLDRRFGWSEPPLAAVLIADALVIAGYLGVLSVFSRNRWAGRTIETRPGQEIVSTGLYAIVRHPMYVATLILYIATPLALGSWWELIPALLCVPMIVIRIRNEENFLLRELPGYEDYRRKVRFRLVPFLW
jgi:protein-S-isoprenylcysteine O-methyltransferase Ste14